jgi:hypothetical protein
MSETQPITLSQATVLLGAAPVANAFECRFVRAGRVRTAAGEPSDIEIEAQALQEAVAQGLFEGRAVFIDHASPPESPSLRNLVGVTELAVYDAAEQAVHGRLRLYETPDGRTMQALLTRLLEDVRAGRPVPDVGLSLTFYPRWGKRDPHSNLRRVVGIRQIESVDLVFQPAADGRVLETLSQQKGTFMNAEESIPLTSSPAVEETTASAKPADSPAGQESQPDLSAATMEDWSQALSASAAAFMIANSGLPAAARQKLLAQRYRTPSEVVEAIEKERAYLASLAQEAVIQIGNTPPRQAQITVGASGLERLEQALEALIRGVRPPSGVQPLSGIRELYNLLSGDYEMTGVFQPQRVYLANVNSSTMANLVANVMNKVLAQEFSEYPQWWQPFVTQMDFNSLQDIRWITLGGVGELPTVAEGAAYTELNWGDKYETASFVKKGGYLGITIEAIDKDDTNRLRAAPRALAQAAWLTVGKAISNIFTANNGGGPTLSDGLPLFHASHGNLGSTALSYSSWVAARNAMRKQSEVGSSERLGFLTAPRYLLVPPDLEVTALQILASTHDYSYTLANGLGPGPINVFSEGETADLRLRSARERVVVVDLWSDANDWAAVADPRLYPSIGLGYRYGRAPEIYSVSSPTAGLMFSNDVMPIKVRFFFAVGPVDYRGLYKANVS